DEEKAFYASVAFDFEVETSIGWLELVACNYRSDYDLKGHASTSKQNLEVVDPADQTKVLPHVFELSMGIDRSIYTILEHCYYVDEQHDDRVVLRLKPYLAPVLVGILPLVTRDGLGQKARKIHSDLKYDFDTFYDESGSMRRRYRRLEEVGAPLAITMGQKASKMRAALQFAVHAVYGESGSIGRRCRRLDDVGAPVAIPIAQTTLQDDTATVRRRDTLRQERVKASELRQYVRHALLIAR